MTSTSDYRKSPYCDAFPIYSDEETKYLEESIQRDIDDGVAEVEVYVSADDTSLVLDGWHRLAACANLGIKPTIVYWDGDAGELAWRANMARRHLTPGDRARAILKVNELRVKEGKEPMGLREMAREADVSLGTIQYHTPDEPKKASEGGVYTDQIHTPQSGDDDDFDPFAVAEQEAQLEGGVKVVQTDADGIPILPGQTDDEESGLPPLKQRRISAREKEQEFRDTLRRNTDLEEQVRALEEAADDDTKAEMLTLKNIQHEVKALRSTNEALQADNDRLRNDNTLKANRIKELVVERDDLKRQLAQLTG